MRADEVTIDDYRGLGEFRYQIRRFLRFSEQVAREAGIEPQQHQLLLAIKGLPEGVVASISILAERLQIQHHSAVELVDRLVERTPDVTAAAFCGDRDPDGGVRRPRLKSTVGCASAPTASCTLGGRGEEERERPARHDRRVGTGGLGGGS